ncbi:HNH endonuclease [Flavobacterium plurextorum]|uniref:HNH endonuclease n=1 Tax=Flavobacterium plurextorum TaxID=1114867 RepID=UPI0013FD4FB7|nr:HNH endonuclease [Flavobacterium plurextorum]
MTKEAEPVILTTNKMDWTTQLLNHIVLGTKIPKSLENNYNKKEIKDSLRKESHSKCMYCESMISHITFEHIEHIKPKAKDKFPQFTFEYFNLGLSCPKCNMNKSDTYDNLTPFIDPYNDDPKNHFEAIGAFLWAKSGDIRAKITEIEIDLNRPELLEIRGERMRTIRTLIDNFNTTPVGVLKDALKKEIDKEIDQNKPYSFCARKLVDMLCI